MCYERFHRREDKTERSANEELRELFDRYRGRPKEPRRDLEWLADREVEERPREPERLQV